MPTRSSRFAGISVLLLLAGCGQPLADAPALTPSAPTPTVRTGPPREAQRLRLSGDISGAVTRLVLDDTRYRSECTGKATHRGEAFAWTLYAYQGDRIYGMVLVMKPYQGPTTYSSPAVRVEVHTPDHEHVWQTDDGDAATVTVDSSELTGSIDATLHSAANQSILRVKGRWNCRP
jgi:hypothetical protein